MGKSDNGTEDGLVRTMVYPQFKTDTNSIKGFKQDYINGFKQIYFFRFTAVHLKLI